MADAADAGYPRAQDAAAVAIGCCLKDILPDYHLRCFVHDAQVRWIYIGDFARAVDDADTILYRLENHLQAFLHQRILVEQQVHLMNLPGRIHFEVAFQEADHLVNGLPPFISFGCHKKRITTTDFERDQFHQAVHLKPLTALTAKIKRRTVFLSEFLCPLDNHRRNSGMDAAVVMNHSFLLKHHSESFLSVLSIIL